ncbi:TetR/AcrR family transcriptional regulator [Pseudomonas sp. NPDC096950]|uniref:TetR/AcrR family transcriptional regulator n=1 Tax=Pseudomonas sp. NPDC096950 TaxID=3364485 RepID=UPI00383BE745
MNLISAPDLPRKRPAQARSVATLEIIYEATLQVLVKEGPARCNTTRVAERAGVSVGTIYQYYPNRRALLAGVLERHLESVAQAIEQACATGHGATTGEMGAAIANAFLDAKLLRAEASRALYTISESHGGVALVAIARERMLRAVCSVLSSASDRRFAKVETVALVLLGAVAGPVRELLEQDYDDVAVASIREQLVNLASGYLQSFA